MNADRKAEIFKNLRADYKAAKTAKVQIEKLITEWNDYYYAEKLGNEVKNRSQIVMKEIAKQIEWTKPNLMEPFTSTSMPVRMKSGISEGRSNILEKYLNQEFVGNFDRETFMDQLSDVMLREGTVWIHTSWSREEITIKDRFKGKTLEELVEIEDEPEGLEEDEDGNYSGYYTKAKVLENCPTAEICRNEQIFPDPTARTEKEMGYLFYERTVTIAELRKEGVKEKYIERLMSDTSSSTDSSLGNQRNIDNRSYGQNQDYKTTDKERQKITIVEYWGNYSLDDDGLLEPIKATFAVRGNVNFEIEENPMPSKKIPFFREVYSSRPFSLWGNALAYFLGDNQRIRSGLMRGILDNMSNANNGQKMILRGALDYVNMKRLTNGEKYVVVNKPDGIKDGAYNIIPTSVFSTMEMITNETQELSGVSAGGPALNNKALGDDGKEEQLTMSQQRMAGLVRKISSLLGKVMKEWLEMAEVFLDDDQIVTIQNTDNPDMNIFMDMYKANCKMMVGTEIVRSNRMKNLNMLMQQSKTLGEQTPEGTLVQLTAEMFELMDMPEKAKEMRDYKPEPSQEQIAMQQMSVQKAQLDLEEMQTKMAVSKMDAETRRLLAQKGLIEAQANVQYKKAQETEKYAKAQSHGVETALKPVEMEERLTNTNKNIGE